MTSRACGWRCRANFWVDLVRGCVRILLPLSILATLLLIAAGVVQNLADPHTVTTLTGSTQHLPGGAIASQEAIKELGHQRRRLLQRQLRAPVREPQRVHEPARDLACSC